MHRDLGPDILESAYRRCLVHWLRLRGVAVASEVSIDLEYKALLVPAAYRLHLLVAEGDRRDQSGGPGHPHP
ncbi:MAG: GxxExxY protein [Alphaproteobacteria bacterium]|nr:GxxExxY protein [Alphaproteobacteria bacterium]